MGLYEVPLSMSLLCFGMGTMLVNFHMCGIMGCGGVGEEWIGGLDQGLEGWGGVMSV